MDQSPMSSKWPAPPREKPEYSTSRRRLRLSALSLQMASQLAPSPSGLSEPTALCLSVYRVEPSHTAHSRGNFHLRSRPSGKETKEMESFSRSVVDDLYMWDDRVFRPGRYLLRFIHLYTNSIVFSSSAG